MIIKLEKNCNHTHIVSSVTLFRKNSLFYKQNILCIIGYIKKMSFSNKWTKPQNEINNVGMKLLENIKPPISFKTPNRRGSKKTPFTNCKIRKYVHENGRERSNDF